MDKQIEIQNMIEIVEKVFSSDYSGDYESGIRDFATRLIQNNVKILPEDSVVLTKEELMARDYECYNLGYETHKQESQKREDYIETLLHHINDLENALLIARKENAREILKDIDNALHDLAIQYADAGHITYFAVCENVYHTVVRKVAKQYGVEIGEEVWKAKK